VQIYDFFSRYTNKNAVFALKDGILGGHARDFRCYMLRCGGGTSSTIIRLSYGYLSVILLIWLLNCCWTVAELLLIFVSKETVFWGMDGRIRNRGDWKEMGLEKCGDNTVGVMIRNRVIIKKTTSLLGGGAGRWYKLPGKSAES